MLSFGKNTYSFYYSYRILEDKIRILLKNQNSYLKAIKFNPLALVTKYIYISNIYEIYAISNDRTPTMLFSSIIYICIYKCTLYIIYKICIYIHLYTHTHTHTHTHTVYACSVVKMRTIKMFNH